MARVFSILIALTLAPAMLAQSNVDTTNKWAWGENIGWLNWRDAGNPAGTQGVVFETNHLRGYIWGENIGWINLDDNNAFVGVNLSCPGDVNNDGQVNLADLNLVLANFGTICN